VSPTGIVYEPGVPPRATRYSQTAALYLGQEQWDRALEQALQGLAADSLNPIHYFVAGSAYIQLEEYAEADELWRRAQQIYPAYELEIEPAREAAWAETFNVGVERYLSGDVEGAVLAWERAALIYDLRPDVHQNLGVVLGEVGEYGRAAEVYRQGLAGLQRAPATRVLDATDHAERAAARANMEANLARLLLVLEEFAEAETLLRRQLSADPHDVELILAVGSALSGQDREDEANEIYAALLRSPDLTAHQLTQIGIALFQSEDYWGAAEAFGAVTGLEPNGRDGWFNYANALLALGEWDTLADVAVRLVGVDPLSESSSLIHARAQVEVANEEAARNALEHIETLPVLLDDLQLWRSGAGTTVRGSAVGNGVEPGAPIRVRFIFYDGRERLGEEVLEVAAPHADESSGFAVTFQRPATAYRYELIDPPVRASGEVPPAPALGSPDP
jgi:tetratricopeptide (TPR) repeat protein